MLFTLLLSVCHRNHADYKTNIVFYNFQHFHCQAMSDARFSPL